jgi:Uma2 family endonuclease
MPARPHLAPADQMTIEEFLDFTETRPDEERWELIEGVPVLSPSPVDYHQIVVANIIHVLMLHKAKCNAAWLPMPGIGTRVPISPNSLPQPDVFIKEHLPTGLPHTEDALLLIEVLSRSDTKADQAWRRRVYASVPNCQHDVTVSLKAPEVVAYHRATGWQARKITGIESVLALPMLELHVPLADIYRYTPFGN